MHLRAKGDGFMTLIQFDKMDGFSNAQRWCINWSQCIMLLFVNPLEVETIPHRNTNLWWSSSRITIRWDWSGAYTSKQEAKQVHSVKPDVYWCVHVSCLFGFVWWSPSCLRATYTDHMGLWDNGKLIQRIGACGRKRMWVLNDSCLFRKDYKSS